MDEIEIKKADFEYYFPKREELKPLTSVEKRWIIQRLIMDILNREDIRILNRHRYNEYLKKNKLRHNPLSMEKWLKCKDKEFKKMEKIPEKTMGIFTSKFKEYQLHVILSECQDLLNRKQSPNLYIWGIRSRKI